MSQTRPWHRLPPSRVTAEVALRQGMALLDGAGADDPVTTAWWIVDSDALVLGRGSRVEADAEKCLAEDVQIVRRASGGGPVLWGPDLLALDVVIPKGHSLHSADVVDSYRWLGEALAGAITALGVDATAVAPAAARAEDHSLGQLACYASVSPWEVTIDGRKVVGLSQVRRRGGTLLQAGIVLAVDAERLPALLALDADTRASVSSALTTRATGLQEHVQRAPHDVMSAVNDALTD